MTEQQRLTFMARRQRGKGIGYTVTDVPQLTLELPFDPPAWAPLAALPPAGDFFVRYQRRKFKNTTIIRNFRGGHHTIGKTLSLT